MTSTTLLFCPSCFASSEDGSWGHTVESYGCANCGSSPPVSLESWAVAAIRRNASWVGSRYYPNKEDLETQAELEFLRSKRRLPKRDKAEQSADGYWTVTRSYGKGETRSISGMRSATEEEARRSAQRSLPTRLPKKT